jgi:dephospho-CoA kinase
LHGTISGCDNRLCILDAALIPYWKIEGWFDNVYWIEASEEIRFKRIAEGSSITSEELRKRIDLQRELFAEPAGGGWITIPNEGTTSEFKKIINTFINI